MWWTEVHVIERKFGTFHWPKLEGITGSLLIVKTAKNGSGKAEGTY
jgi:hypothetical protein